ncbi:MAG: hypothetical protein IJY25_01330 [Bacilli bacterium]|nr:hypothetical protein [Bacilli bacterium]
MASFVYSDEDQMRYDHIKEVYQRTLPSKVRKSLRGSFLFNIFRCFMVSSEKTFYPEMKRKKYLTRLFDNFKWYFKYHRVNLFYNRFGLDIKNFRSMDDYLDFGYVKKDRAMVHHKKHPLVKVRKANVNDRYSIIADDKSVFYSYVGSMFPNNIPNTVFTFSGNKVIAPYEKYSNTRVAFKNLPDGKYICKPTVGSHGDMIVALTKKGNSIKLSNKEVTLSDLIKSSIQKPFLVQEFLKQHADINKINDETVNTLRIISTRWNEKTHILAAMIRVGAKKGQVVDNADAGGTFIAINTNTGKLDKYGYFYNKPRTTSHPVTGLVYNNYQIPYWKETVELIKNLHPIIFGFATIGWDIAITETGPVIVEINWNYSFKGIQVCNGGLKPRWEELKYK